MSSEIMFRTLIIKVTFILGEAFVQASNQNVPIKDMTFTKIKTSYDSFTGARRGQYYGLK